MFRYLILKEYISDEITDNRVDIIFYYTYTYKAAVSK